jgi:hypothetical protein
MRTIKATHRVTCLEFRAQPPSCNVRTQRLGTPTQGCAKDAAAARRARHTTSRSRPRRLLRVRLLCAAPITPPTLGSMSLDSATHCSALDRPTPSPGTAARLSPPRRACVRPYHAVRITLAAVAVAALAAARVLCHGRAARQRPPPPSASNPSTLPRCRSAGRSCSAFNSLAPPHSPVCATPGSALINSAARRLALSTVSLCDRHRPAATTRA